MTETTPLVWLETRIKTGQLWRLGAEGCELVIEVRKVPRNAYYADVTLHAYGNRWEKRQYLFQGDWPLPFREQMTLLREPQRRGR